MEYITGVIHGFYKGENVHNLRIIWALFMFEIWHRAYLDRNILAEPVI